MIILIFAILFGLVGAYGVRRQLAQQPPEPVPEPTGPPTMRIPIASMDIEPGRPLTLGDLAIVSGANSQLRKDFDLPATLMTNSNQVIGRILREPIAKGAGFSPEMFYPEGQGPSVAERLKPGYRAVTIPVTGAGALNGYASPTSFVDILFRTGDGVAVSPTTVTLLEAVEVVALNRDSFPGSQKQANTSNVTVAVTPEQAHALKITEGRGTFSLVLRSPDDTIAVSKRDAVKTIEDLLNLPVRRGNFTAEIYRGSSRSSQTFSRGAFQPVEKVQVPITGIPQDNTNVNVNAGAAGAGAVSKDN
jgi:Flp pilus assembly protein CpaB